MHFAEPYWLWTGAVVVALLFVLRVRAERLTTRALHALAGARMVNAGALPSRFRRWLRVAVTCVAVGLGFVALARPQRGLRWETLDRKGTDLLLVIDTSKSMNADDVAPTRLERTKLAVRDLVERFPGDRIGLVAFAGDAFLESPMTLDHSALLETLGAFDTSLISRPGTDIGRAIDSATATLKTESDSQRVMVLLTDGEDLQGKGLEAAKRAGEAGITIETVGVGTPAGELVPMKNDQGLTVGVIQDENGAAVRSHLDEGGLRAIAQAGHGTYRPLGADGLGLDRLYAESLAPMSHIEHGAHMRRVYAEWFAVPLSLSLFGMVLDALLGWRPRLRERSPVPGRRTSARAKAARAGAAAAAALMVALLPGRASASVTTAEKAYAAGNFDESAKDYDTERKHDPKDARLAIDVGAAAYRAKHYDDAEAALTQALTLAEPQLQQRVLYDLGDARYRQGTTTLKDAPQKTIERWKAAIGSYEGALKLSPGDADARFNRDFVKRELAKLENQQKEQQPQDDKSNQDKKDQGSKGKDQNGQPKNDKGKDPSGKGESSGKDGKPDKDQGGDQAKKDGDAKGSGAQGAKVNAQPDGAKKPGQPDGAGQPIGAQQPGTAPNGATGANSDGQKSGAAPGRLSPDGARALLDSLRGEEQHGVRFGNSNAQAGDDSPQKDW